MRKFLSLLAIAAVFVTFAGGKAFAAQQLKLTATISFSAQTTPALTAFLYDFTGAVPLGTETAVSSITWIKAGANNSFTADLASATSKYISGGASSMTWHNSRTYEKITCSQIADGTVVRFHTSNSVGTAFKYSTGMVDSNMLAMACMHASSTTAEIGLPIAYRLSDPASVGTGKDIPDVGALSFVLPAPPAAYGIYGVQDSSNTAYGANGTASAEYSTIATSLGFRYGYGSDGKPQYKYSANDTYYIFFGTSLGNAKKGYIYGTDTLTIDVIGQ